LEAKSKAVVESLLRGISASTNIPFIDEKSVQHATAYLDAHAKDENPFFLYLNTAKLRQPNLPHPDFVGKSMAKSKYLDSLVELDHNVGVVVDKVRELGIAEDTLIFWTTDNGAWQDVYPDCGYTPFKGTKGTDYEGGSRVPAIAWWPGTIEPGRRNSEIAGSLDFMATFASLAGLELPTEDCEGKPTIFDSCDQTALVKGTGPSTRDTWYYLIETEEIPGAVRVGKWKAVWNLRQGWRGRGRVCGGGARPGRPLAGSPGTLRHLHEPLDREDVDDRPDRAEGVGAARELQEVPEPSAPITGACSAGVLRNGCLSPGSSAEAHALHGREQVGRADGGAPVDGFPGSGSPPPDGSPNQVMNSNDST
jgi:Sulfatase